MDDDVRRKKIFQETLDRHKAEAVRLTNEELIMAGLAILIEKMCPMTNPFYWSIANELSERTKGKVNLRSQSE